MEKAIINQKETQKGITLIALVITIIVLLILAGVSIAMLTGQNGILTQAQNAKTTTENKSAEEKVKLAVMGARADDYTGTYTADYANFSGTEYLFGGTSIKREAGKELSIDCTLEITEGTAKVFWISGSDEAVTLIEATGTYSDTITLPDGGNYIGIECENFTGNVELNIE